ncbi:Selenocysteine lyase/Cysteine desulfurase [Filimonas lacunae]|uniref:Selenocysteine lyase/Cysteine desulfurase n=1 Tax=Filimonas lacunae TaxID=477680 RepID=A0A173MLZ1_9BACT|nr:aminotransferase class V-fold PLP-dependent enzyme [Filimonas lacunae]BAV08652.1 cysteine desulfurase [Filimonas lacunae]SIS59300.1 Selenocysteine lyase/Cysteine desulfurase [Filimonas lacunae]
MNFSPLFPVLETCTYLNTANAGLLSVPLMEWRRETDRQFSIGASEFRSTTGNAIVEDARQTIAGYFHAKPGYTFLVPNMSFGFGKVLDGLEGPQRVLLLQDDYPSITYQVKSRGWEHEFISLLLYEQLEQRILEAVKRFRPTMLACSITHYLNGITLNLDLFAAIKAAYPSLLIVADATQYFGTTAFHFEDTAIDIVLASGYKWLSGGYGNGVVLVKEEAAARLYTKAQQLSGPNELFLKEKNKLALQFEPGHLDFISYGSLGQAIRLRQEWGEEQLLQHIDLLSAKAMKAFTERGVIDAAISMRKQHAPIFTIQVSDRVKEAIRAANIIGVNRGTGLRVSLHYYNTKQELQQLLEVMDK